MARLISIDMGTARLLASCGEAAKKQLAAKIAQGRMHHADAREASATIDQINLALEEVRSAVLDTLPENERRLFEEYPFDG